MSTAPLSCGHNKRSRRTRAQVDQLDAQILEVLEEDRPQSIRHVFYRMTDPRLPEPVEKSEAGYRAVQYRIVELRRSGALPYNWITDATRRGHFVDVFSGPADFVARMAGYYRADLWAQANVYCEVWCESRSIAGVIEDTCEHLAVSLYPAGGFTSMSLAYQAASYIGEVTRQRAIPAKIIYIGDYDPAGVLIDVAIERELRQHLPDSCDLEFQRIAVNRDQIAKWDLPEKPRKQHDKRAQHVQSTVEAEAIPAGVLRKLLRESVEAYLPPGALHAAQVAEQSERAGLLAMARAMERSS